MKHFLINFNIPLTDEAFFSVKHILKENDLEIVQINANYDEFLSVKTQVVSIIQECYHSLLGLEGYVLAGIILPDNNYLAAKLYKYFCMTNYAASALVFIKDTSSSNVIFMPTGELLNQD